MFGQTKSIVFIITALHTVKGPILVIKLRSDFERPPQGCIKGGGVTPSLVILFLLAGVTRARSVGHTSPSSTRLLLHVFHPPTSFDHLARVKSSQSI